MAAPQTRRAYLCSVVTAVTVAAAGCTDSDANAETGAGTADPEPTARSTSAAPPVDGIEPSDGSFTAGVDLREANVTAVTIDCDGRECRFDVTLYHDDDGEDGYADWWQVETRGGDRLGRRDLLHAHGTREFTRSATITVADGVAEVIVRGHDQTHGYGGRAMLVDVATGDVTAVRQGQTPDSLGS
jgi:hypothetical protein